MVRRISCFVLSLMLMAACASSEKLLEKGRYDKAIDKSISKLRKDPNDGKELRVLKEAYGKANGFDLDRIDFLKQEGREENWVEIYRLYENVKYRQDKLKTLPTSVLNQFTLVSYDDELIESKELAAGISYDRGIEYLNRGDRQSARMAYREFERTKSIYADYKDVDRMLEEARFLGTNKVLFRIENNSEKVLPERFDEELKKIGLGDLAENWVIYDTYADSTIYYDYYVVLNIRDIEISPESIDRKTYTESKEIQDGTRYVFDENGNVKKDSLGNDIKVPNMITVTAEITESVQHKEALVAGSIDYIDLRSDQMVKTEKISVNAVFKHFSAVATGDKRALTEETREKVGNDPAPFPSSEIMLMDAAELLKNRTKAILHANRRLVSN